jgi:hypothetical protein
MNNKLFDIVVKVTEAREADPFEIPFQKQIS